MAAPPTARPARELHPQREGHHAVPELVRRDNVRAEAGAVGAWAARLTPA